MSAPSLVSLIRCVISYPRTTGLSADTQTNTIYVGSDTEADPDDVISIADGEINQFVDAIDQLLPSSMFLNHVDKIYFDMLDDEPRVPRVITTHTTSLNNDPSLPLETSMVVSFEGERISGVNQQRRRGRIYLPTMVNTITQDTTDYVRWAGLQTAAVAGAAETMKADLLSASCSWAVWSRTIASATAGSTLVKARAATTYIIGGFVDNEPDTQRRRGGPQGTKTNWS